MRRVLPVVVIVLALAGCGSGDSANSVTTPAQETVPAGPKPEKQIVVHETEFALDPANAAGGVEGLKQIKVVNDGKVTHSLAVDGPNGLVELDGSVEPGQTATLEADLDKPGTYTWYCPLDGHRGKGMSGSITVGGSTPARGAEGQSTTTTQTTPTQTETTTQTQTETKTVTTPTQTTTTKTSTSPTATTGTPSGY